MLYGFHAFTRDAEAHTGPTEQVYVTQIQLNVTDKIRQGLDEIQDPVLRSQHIEDRIKELINEDEAQQEDNIRV